MRVVCWDANGILGYGIPIRFKLGSNFKGGFDGLAQVRWALNCVPGVVAGYNLE
jgi:hypothetical protein